MCPDIGSKYLSRDSSDFGHFAGYIHTVVNTIGRKGTGTYLPSYVDERFMREHRFRGIRKSSH